VTNGHLECVLRMARWVLLHTHVHYQLRTAKAAPAAGAAPREPLRATLAEMLAMRVAS